MESNCSTNTSTAFAAAASGAAAPATGLVALYAVAEAAGARRPPRAPTALSLSRVRGRTGKTKVKMSASTKQNSDKHVYGAQATGVHQAFTNGYQRGSIKHSLMDPSRGREEFNTHNVKGWSTHMLVLLRNLSSSHVRGRTGKTKVLRLYHILRLYPPSSPRRIMILVPIAVLGRAVTCSSMGRATDTKGSQSCFQIKS